MLFIQLFAYTTSLQLQSKMTNLLSTVKGMLQRLIPFVNSNEQAYARTEKLFFDPKSILLIIKAVKQLFLSQSTLLTLLAPIKIFGDLHSQFFDLLRWFQYIGLSLEHYEGLNENCLFLGNYINGGKYGLETILTIFCLKIVNPSKIWVLRGNMETQCLTKIAGFQHQCISRTSKLVYQSFIDVFAYFPIAAVVSDKILCIHGGLSPRLVELSTLAEISRPQPREPSALVNDILWSDPDQEIQRWSPNHLRNNGHYFGSQVVQQFLQRNNLQLICRSHEFCPNGYKISAQSQVVTIFSAPNYLDRMQNSGCVLSISESLQCRFLLLKPERKDHLLSEKGYVLGKKTE